MMSMKALSAYNYVDNLTGDNDDLADRLALHPAG